MIHMYIHIMELNVYTHHGIMGPSAHLFLFLAVLTLLAALRVGGRERRNIV